MGFLSSLFSNILLMLNENAAPRRSALRVLSNRATLVDNATLQTTDLDLRPIETGGSAVVIFQPGGAPAANIVTTEAEVQAALDAALEFGIGGGVFVIDGTYQTDIVLTGVGFQLYSFFEVRMVGVATISVGGMVDGSALFYEPRGSVRSDGQVSVLNSSSTRGIYFSQFDVSTGISNVTCTYTNITFSHSVTAMIRPFARIRRGGYVSLTFENCSFNYLRNVAGVGSVVWVQDLQVQYYDVYWHGSFAGRWDNTYVRLFYTTLTNVGTSGRRVQYNPAHFSAPAFTWPVGADWASSTPIITNLHA